MSYLELEIADEDLRLLRVQAESRGIAVEELAVQAVRTLLPLSKRLPKISGPVGVPADFDWTKNSSWHNLIDAETGVRD